MDKHVLDQLREIRHELETLLDELLERGCSLTDKRMLDLSCKLDEIVVQMLALQDGADKPPAGIDGEGAA